MSRDRHENLFRVLQFFCPPQLYEGIEGDLKEAYELDFTRIGARRAQWKLIRNTIRFLRPEIILRNKIQTIKFYLPMWKNYVRVGWRNILKNSLYSVINAFGLALGIGFSYLTFLYVSGELKYDKFHDYANRIYRVVETTTQMSTREVLSMSSVTAVPLGEELAVNYPEIEKVTRYGSFGTVVERNDESFGQVVVVADQSFFDVFKYETLKGSKDLFKAESELVLSEKAASIYFGDKQAVGKPLSVMIGSSRELFTVVAVVDNHASESSLGFDVMIPFKNYEKVVGMETFNSMNYGMIETYVLLKESKSVGFLQEKINEKFYIEAEKEGASEVNLFTLQPLTAIHLDTAVRSGIAQLGNPIYVYVLTGLGFLILFMACVNFISLTSGHTFSRIKEVGVRKVMGAQRGQIRNQLMAESFIICFIAAGIGLVLVYWILPFFNLLINATVAFNLDLQRGLFLAALLLVIVLIAGGVPARILVTLQPVHALKNSMMSTGKDFMKRTMVLIQFTLSLILIIGTLVMNVQMDFIKEKNLGFDKERLYEITLNDPASAEAANQIVTLFKSEVSLSPRVTSATAAMNDHQQPWTKLAFEQVEGKPIDLYFNLVDPDYMKTMRLELVSGRWFDENTITEESHQVVVNESLLKYFQWDDFEGKQIPGKNFSDTHEIIGVVKDFHFSSLHNNVAPLILTINFDAISSGVTGLTTHRWPPLYNDIIVKISPGEFQPALKEIESVWKAANPDAPFRGNFVDELLEAQYVNEQRWEKIINYSSIFAFAIAILGLIGLVRLLLQRKTKEIGIRKVLGSGYVGLALHFSRRFIAVLLGANLIAWPIAWWAGRQWLQSFTYRIDLTIVPFAVAAIVVCMAVFTVVGCLTWVASQTRPVDVLRNE